MNLHLSLLAIIAVGFVYLLYEVVKHRDEQMSATASDEMWARTIEEYRQAAIRRAKPDAVTCGGRSRRPLPTKTEGRRG